MSTIPLTVHLDSSLYQRAWQRAQSENVTLQQVVADMLHEWSASQPALPDRYVVRAGDTLARIAFRLYGDATKYVLLAQANGITDPRLLRVGQVLIVPPPGGAPLAPLLPGEPSPPAGPAPQPSAPPAELEIEFVPSPHFNQRPQGTRIWALVIHATANSSLEGVIRWFTNPESNVSAHYNIGKDGRVVQMVHDQDRAWHAGQSMWKGVLNVNDFAIGIELVNLNDGLDPYPQEQYRVLVALCARLVARYSIQIEDIMGHKDISLSGKTDPAGLDLERLRQDVQAAAL
jgi:LysM repeat protein